MMDNQEPVAPFILHAPNVHTGGGLFLLISLLKSANLSLKWAQLDARASTRIALPKAVGCRYIHRSVWSRLLAEFRLWFVAKRGEQVLCFHGLPPLLPLRATAVVFLQNRLIFEGQVYIGGSLTSRINIYIQRIWMYMTRKRAIRYVVQTPSMAAAVKQYLGQHINITLCPFMPSVRTMIKDRSPQHKKHFDFIYIASGEPHKNHRLLFDAWCLLAIEGLKPSLAITIDVKKYASLYDSLKRHLQTYDLTIENLGCLNPTDVNELYQRASALIFPSQVESFGLPLLDAANHGLPILASELDYVRDVVMPTETFDPSSAISISRAVKRFLGVSTPTMPVYSPENFLADIMGLHK